MVKNNLVKRLDNKSGSTLLLHCFINCLPSKFITSRKAGQHVLFFQVMTVVYLVGRWRLAFLETLGLLIPGDLSYLGTPYTWGPLIPGDPSYLGTPHTWGPLLPGDPSYLGTPHTWGPLIPGDPSYLGTPHTWGPLIPGDPSYLGTPHTLGPLLPGDPSYLRTPHTQVNKGTEPLNMVYYNDREFEHE